MEIFMEESRIKIKKPKLAAKKGWRFNLLDLVIIFLLLLFATGCVIMLLPQVMDIIGGAGNTEIVYTVVFDEVDETLALTANIYDGQSAVDRSTGRVVGTVTGDALIGDAYQNVIANGSEGGMVLIESAVIDGKKTVTVTMTASATYSEGRGYEVNGCRIATNAEYEMMFPGFTGKGICTVVTVNSEG